MDRGLKAAFLFSMVVVAQADRALTAHKPSTGGLHAVAVLRTIPTSVKTAATTVGDEATFTAVGNYLITNGNGTWTYSYYSNAGNLNNNDAGQGGDWVYPNSNTAFFNSNGAVGALVQTVAAPIPVATYDDETTATAAASAVLESPLSLYLVGLNSLVFTGAKTGIAVGVSTGFNGLDQDAAALASPQTVLTSQKLNILLTYDGATTWVRATGLPKNNLLVNDAAQVAGTVGTIVAPLTPPYPSSTVGDLTSVFFASKSLGWTVGGNAVSFAAATSDGNGLGPNGITVNAAVATATQIAVGYVFMSQNGGSVWKYVPTWISYSSLLPLWSNNDPSLKVIFQTPIPGILFGVSSDASGKHVYAVGSPSSLYSKGAAGVAISYLTNNAAVAVSFQVKTFGTILYSGNSGMSWVQQTAPTLYSGLAPYTLFDVAVQKGTTAVAVGGSASIKYGQVSAGTIVYTMNGGFSWTQSVYPSSTGSKAPVFTCVALQPSVAGVQTVWVGGFTTRTDAALAGLTPPTTAVDFYPVAAVTGFNPTTGAAVASGVPRVKGQIYTILISKDGGKTFAAVPTAGLPTGFVVTSFTAPSTLQTDRSVYGITWDNAQHGWIFGYGFIMSTQNGGATWVYETPSDVGVLTVSPKVSTLASVPTTY